jgi:hypothetical protein
MHRNAPLNFARSCRRDWSLGVPECAGSPLVTDSTTTRIWQGAVLRCFGNRARFLRHQCQGRGPERWVVRVTTASAAA